MHRNVRKCIKVLNCIAESTECFIDAVKDTKCEVGTFYVKIIANEQKF